MQEQDVEYAGFWIRLLATIVDLIFMVLITLPLLIGIYKTYYLYLGMFDITGFLDFFISFGLPAIVTIVFWIYKAATPGKMVISAKIVDAQTGEKATNGQLIGRYFAYFISAIPFGLGVYLDWV